MAPKVPDHARRSDRHQGGAPGDVEALAQPESKRYGPNRSCRDRGEVGGLAASESRRARASLTPALTPTDPDPNDGDNILAEKISPDGTSLYVAAAGVIDQYNIAADGTLTPKSPPSVPSDGGAVMAVNTAGTALYTANENGIDQYSIGAGGLLSALSPAHIAVGLTGDPLQPFALNPDGQHAYGMSEGGITVFNVAPDGTLSANSATVAPDAFPESPYVFSAVAVNADGTGVYATTWGGFYVAGSGFPVGAGGSAFVAEYKTEADGSLTPNSPGQVLAVDPPTPYACPTFGCELPTFITLNAPKAGQTFAATTTSAVSCTPASDTVGVATNCTATVTGDGAQPVGSVNFSTDSPGSFDSSSCTLVAGAADVSSCSVNYTPGPVAVGTHTITAQFSTSDFATLYSSATTTVNVTDPTSVSCSPASVAVGTSTTCTASVTGTTPSGSVAFTATNAGNTDPSGTFSPASCTLSPVSTTDSSCSVTYTPTQFGNGQHTVDGAYTGDSNNPATSAVFALTVTAASTTTAVSCVPATDTVGMVTTCTAAVTGSSAQPVGSVGFSTDSDGTFGSSTCTLVAGSADESACSSTYTPGLASAGTHTITASYTSSDGSTGASSGSTTVSVTTPASISCSPSTVEVGFVTTCTASVSGTSPTGTMTFTANNDNLYLVPPFYVFNKTTCKLVAVSSTLSSCSVKYTPQVDGGPDSVTATYSGDVNNPVSAASVVVPLTPGGTKTSVSCPATVAVGVAITCNVVSTAVGNSNQPPRGLIELTSNGPGYYAPANASPQDVGPTCTLNFPLQGNASSCSFVYTPTATGTQNLVDKYDAIPDNVNEGGGYDNEHLPSQGSAKVVVTGPKAGASVTGQGATTARATGVAVNPGDLVVAYVSADGPASGGQTVTVSGGGLTWTKAAQENAAQGDSEVWSAQAGAAAKFTVTAKAGIKGSNVALTVVTYQGATGIGASGTFASGGSAPSGTITTTGASSLVWAVGNDGAHANARKVGPGQTLVDETLSTQSTFWVQSRTNASANTSGGGASVTINDNAPTADPFNLVIVEIL